MNVTMALGPMPPAGAALAAGAVALAACYVPVVPQAPLPVRLVVTERWAQGGRLVIVDDAGDRRAVLVAAAPGPPVAIRDEQAVFSPDGRWIAFASTRGRDLAHTSLWLVAARADAVPVRLTDGPGSELSPTWTPDGAALIFASDRAGSFDLYRLALATDDAHAADAAPLVVRAAPIRLTDAPSHELAPTVAPDGRVVAQVIVLGLAPRSYLAEVEPGGGLRPLTDGPLDATPAWAPDGRRLAYATGRLRADGRDDTELMVLDTQRATPPSAVTDLPSTDESGPVWSRDGRWLFATSVVTADDGAPRWSSVIMIDLRDPRFVPRMLRDHVGAIVRAGPALAPARLDELALLRAPHYLPALAEALRDLDDRAAPPAVPDPAARRPDPR